MDGAQTLERIRSAPETYGTPRIIMVSAYGRPDSQLRRLADADEFASKPVTSSTLFDTILSAFRKGATRSARRRTPYSPEQAVQLVGANVLLVEDNEINQQLAREILERAKVVVSVVSNGQEAVDAAARERYDAILMDVQMPVMDGYEATRRIRGASHGDAPVPIIAMTAHALVGDAQKSIDAGMNDHVTKPIDPAILIGTLARWITPRARLDSPGMLPEPEEAAAPERQAVTLPSAIAGIDLVDGLARAGGNTRLYRDVLRRFRRDFRDTAGAMRDHVASSHWEELQRLAHAVAGVAGNVGATSLGRSASDIERAVREGNPSRAAEHAHGVCALLDDVVASLVVLDEDDAGATPSPLPREALQSFSEEFRTELRSAATAADQERLEEIIAGQRDLPGDIAAALRALASNLDFAAIRELTQPSGRNTT
jgi:CheY-like chemotaxis protein